MKDLKEGLVRFFYRFFVPLLIWTLYRALSFTWRVRIFEPDLLQEHLKNRKPLIFAHWHGDEIVLISLIRRYRIATIVSSSIDGDLMNQVIRFLGGKTSRGSSTRGGVSALKGLIRLVREGRNCSFAVDGPKGPLHQVKPGVFELSRTLDAVIFAGGVSCDRAWTFPKSWNKTYLPKPFAKIIINWNGPHGPVERKADPRDKDLAFKLENALRLSGETAVKNFASSV